MKERCDECGESHDDNRVPPTQEEVVATMTSLVDFFRKNKVRRVVAATAMAAMTKMLEDEDGFQVHATKMPEAPGNDVVH